MTVAYILVSHGSRDPRPQIAIDTLALQLRLTLTSTLIDTAQLELGAKPLHLQICDFADRFTDQNIAQIVVLPLFLIPGVHVMDDIPAEVALAQAKVAKSIKLTIAPFLGSNPDFIKLFAQQRSSLPSQSILLAHGSRRTGGNTIVEQLASDLDLTAAYWSISPNLVDLVAKFIATGAREIGVLPYFLFSGGITDSIEQLVIELRVQHPDVKLVLAEPVGNSPELVKTIVGIAQSADAFDFS